MAELLIGCGARRDKLIRCGLAADWVELTTLDINHAHDPDVVWDLGKLPLPFADATFDEIHAYEVLEHTGTQGDYRFFFAQFSDFWRILRPGGHLCATVPHWQSIWAWGDPSHSRVINEGTLAFLDQDQYTRQIERTAMSDFRHIYTADFTVKWLTREGESLWFTLQSVKPSRVFV